MPGFGGEAGENGRSSSLLSSPLASSESENSPLCSLVSPPGDVPALGCSASDSDRDRSLASLGVFFSCAAPAAAAAAEPVGVAAVDESTLLAALAVLSLAAVAVGALPVVAPAGEPLFAFGDSIGIGIETDLRGMSSDRPCFAPGCSASGVNSTMPSGEVATGADADEADADAADGDAPPAAAAPDSASSRGDGGIATDTFRERGDDQAALWFGSGSIRLDGSRCRFFAKTSSAATVCRFAAGSFSWSSSSNALVTCACASLAAPDLVSSFQTAST